MTQYVKTWLIPWQPGQIGIAYTTGAGKIGIRELRERDPEFAQLRSLLGPLDLVKLERHFSRIVPFRRYTGL